MKTETRGATVTLEMKEEPAGWIAQQLNDHERRLTHGRGIDMRTLQDELQLRIEDFGLRHKLKKAVWDYFRLLRDHMDRIGSTSFVHTPHYFRHDGKEQGNRREPAVPDTEEKPPDRSRHP